MLRFLLLAIVASSLGPPPSKAGEWGGGAKPGELCSEFVVVDARTLSVKVHGRNLMIGLIGAGTTEVEKISPKLRLKQEKLATEALREMLKGQQVRIETDPTCRPWKDGITPGYAYRVSDDLLVNEALIKKGIVRRDFLHGGSKASILAKAEDRARGEKVGIWAGPPADDAPTEKVTEEIIYEYREVKDELRRNLTLYLHRDDDFSILGTKDIIGFEDIYQFLKQGDSEHIQLMIENGRAVVLEPDTPIRILELERRGTKYAVTGQILAGEFKGQTYMVDPNSLRVRSVKRIREKPQK